MTAEEALEQLAEAFATGRPEGWLRDHPRQTWSVEYAAWRFAEAWRQSRRAGAGPEFSADHAVLLRQVARWAGGLTLPAIPQELASLAAGKACVRFLGSGRVEADPFVPAWLTDDGDPIPPEFGVDAPPVVRRLDEFVPAERFLTALQYTRWQSPAQKEAAWLAATAPKRSTALIVLPTGTGKSLCFQVAAYASGGLTVVVVPTVALAIDQWRSAVETLRSLGPRYYAADDPSSPPQQVLDELKNGTCRLLLTSPEACVSGRLRDFLGQAAANGTLTNLVIDEAHLVETWGAHFRVDFQFLSSLRRKWLQNAGAEFRTLLLSATISPTSRRVLRQLYGDGGNDNGQSASDGLWREFSSQRLRPEMTYFARSFDGVDTSARRRDAVIDCAWRIPRPAIFYTTEVDAAEDLCAALRAEGFRRVDVFTGETPASERRRLLDRWRGTDEIDLMVATSAFGLGVDKPDVRAVVHACLPENLNRYYQEVGRGGRDGASSACVLLPTARDSEVAAGLLPAMLKPETLQDRWDAMWSERRPVEPEDEHVWRLNPQAQRLILRGERSGRRNAAWNKRLLLQLLRARKLELVDVEYASGADEEDGAEWVTVRIRNFMPEVKSLGQSVAAQRAQELDEATDGLDQVRAYLKGDVCVRSVLKHTFGHGTLTLCSGCRHCRRRKRRPDACPSLPVELKSPPANPRPVLEVVGNCPSPFGATPVEFREMIRQSLRAKGVRRFAVDAPVDGELFRRIRELIGESVQGAEAYRIDTLQGNAPFLVWPEEHVAVLHVDRPSPEGLALDKGRRVAHLFCGPFYAEPGGRHHLLSAGARLFTDWRHWLAAHDGGSC